MNVSRYISLLSKCAKISLCASLCLLSFASSGALGATKINSITTTTLDFNDSSLDYKSPSGDNHTYNTGTDNAVHFTGFQSDTGTKYERAEVGFDVQIQRAGWDINWQNIQYLKNGYGNIDAIGRRVYSMEEALTNADMTSGVTNLFENTQKGSGIYSDIERVDFVYSAGITIQDKNQLDSGFTIIEQGGNNGFKIAAITGVDANGNVTSMGNVVGVGTSDYGNDLTTWGGYSGPTNTTMTVGGDMDTNTDYNHYISTKDYMNGVMVTMEDLGVEAGQTIYGYALFADDVQAGVAAPVSLSDSFYQSQTNNANGGIDVYGSAMMINQSVDGSGMIATTRQYWDRNGSDKKFGTDLSGTWSNAFADNNWSKSSDGDTDTGNWSTGSVAVFDATSASGEYKVEVDDLIITQGMEFSGQNAHVRDTNNLEGKIFLKDEDGAPVVDVAGSTVVQMDAALGGSDGLNKTGTGELVLTASNTISGTVTVSEGTITLARSSGGALENVTKVVVSTGGTIAMDADNQFQDGNTAVSLSGGTFDTNGYDQTMSTLTLTANSVIDVGGAGGSGELVFDASNHLAWSGGLTIRGWTGDSLGGTGSRIFFGSNASSLTASQLSNITFEGGYSALLLSSGELVANIKPVPEPSTLIVGGFLLAAIGLHQYRRFRSAREDVEL